MIQFDLYIDNFFASDEGHFYAIKSYSKEISKNKTFEFEFYQMTQRTLELSLKIKPRFSDHGGISLSFGLFGFITEVSIRDTRHWNHETNDWEKYE